MRQFKTGLWLMALGVWLLVGATYVYADEPGDVRGGYFEYSWSSGQFRWEPFLKIDAPKEAPAENGEAEIWGFRVWNLEKPDKNGKTFPVNILESRFVPCDHQNHLVVIQHPSDPERKVEKRITPPCDVLWK